MKIEALNQFLQIENPTAQAWIAKDKKVNLIFKANSKVYTYRGSIYAVAEQLGLIPEIDVLDEAEKVAHQLRNGATEVLAPAGLNSTIRYNRSDLANVAYRDGGLDEYDRELSVYYRNPDYGKWQ